MDFMQVVVIKILTITTCKRKCKMNGNYFEFTLNQFFGMVYFFASVTKLKTSAVLVCKTLFRTH